MTLSWQAGSERKTRGTCLPIVTSLIIYRGRRLLEETYVLIVRQLWDSGFKNLMKNEEVLGDVHKVRTLFRGMGGLFPYIFGDRVVLNRRFWDYVLYGRSLV